MTRLALDVGTDAVTALVVDAAGAVAARGDAVLPQHHPGPGLDEHVPEEVWRAALAATRDCLGAWAGPTVDLDGIEVTHPGGTALLWDRETLGTPRRAIGAQDRRATDLCRELREAGHEDRVVALSGRPLDDRSLAARLAWLARHEPNTWALVEQGRYAAGGLESYLVARMSRGTWHLTDVAHAARSQLFDPEAGHWSGELCGLFGVPEDALPEVSPDERVLARTDPRSFLGLDLPVATQLR